MKTILTHVACQRQLREVNERTGLLIENNFSGCEISFKVSLKKFIIENQHFGIIAWNGIKKEKTIILF